MDTEQQRIAAREMQLRGGGFASKLADAWAVADSGNREILVTAFGDLFGAYYWKAVRWQKEIQEIEQAINKKETE